MCGIAGIVSLKGNTHHLPNLIAGMVEKLKHRGPDGEGYVLFTKNAVVPSFGKDTSSAAKQLHQLSFIGQGPSDTWLALGHRRVIVNDFTPKAHQPLSFDNGRFWITFNGEIYNAPEIRADLKEQGLTFASNSEAEVILAAYKTWGEQMVNKLDGQWAFVLFDTLENCFFGCRDRFGVKPLYFIHNPSWFAFASEIKALIDLPIINKRVNRSAVFEYLVLGRTEGEPQSMVQHIYELPPASSLSLDMKTGIFKTWHHYHLGYKPILIEFNEEKFQKYSYKIRRLLTSSIQMRLRSDVEVGSLLSGGIDSSSIVTLADKILSKKEFAGGVGHRQKVFSLVFDDTKYDETKWAQEVVNATNTEWIKIKPDFNSFIGDLEDLVYTQDLPFFNTSTYAQYKLMQGVQAAGIKVVLDGQGADELFSGHPEHFWVFMKGMLKSGDYSGFLANFMTANNSFAAKGELTKFLIKSLYMRLIMHYKGRAMSRDSYREFGYIRKEFWDRYKKRIVYENPFILNGLLHKEYVGTELKSHLRMADRNSMRFGVEARMPFAEDKTLAEYVFNIPSVYKTKFGQSKLLLRSALGNTLPLKVMNRRDKNAFNTPQQQLLIQNKDALREYINNDIRDVLDVKAIQGDWNKLLRGTEINPRLWRIINFAVWRKVYKI